MHSLVRSMGPREGPFLLHVRRPCWKHDSLYHNAWVRNLGFLSTPAGLATLFVFAASSTVSIAFVTAQILLCIAMGYS